MLRRFILNLRRKPKHVRDNYALGLAATFTGIVVLVWMFTWPGSADETNNYDAGSTPFATFFDEARDQIGTVKESFEAAVPEAVEEEASTASLQSDNIVEQAIARATTTNRPATTSAPIRLVPVSATATAATSSATSS